MRVGWYAASLADSQLMEKEPEWYGPRSTKNNQLIDEDDDAVVL
jgi:hypothetical protein